MTYADEFGNFHHKKTNFFSSAQSKESAEALAEEMTFRFLANNKRLIEQEFNHLFAVLKAEAKKTNNNEKFYLWCYCCCLMMAKYFEHYHNAAAAEKQKDKFVKSKEYEELCKDLKDIFVDLEEEVPKKSNAEKASFFKKLQQKLSDDLNYILSIPMRTTELINWVGFLNVCRIYWAFCRLTLVQTLTLSKGTYLLEKLNTLLNKQIDIDKIIHTMNAPSEIFRALSVGFFVMRFMIHSGLILKHTLFAKDVESDKTIDEETGEMKGLTSLEQISSELWKRHPKMVNDIVWMIINTLCNYNTRLGISNTAAAEITAIFLVFDMLMILYCRQNAKNEYLLKKAQYQKDRELFYQAGDLFAVMMTDKQIIELEIEWAATSETYLFNAVGAFILGLGFSASMLLAAPVAIVGCYFVCMIGVAVYLSDGAYSQYAEANARYEQALVAGVGGEALSEFKDSLISARNNLLWTLLKNALLPSFMIIAYAVCWQAALLLTVSLLAYQFINATLETTVPQAEMLEPPLVSVIPPIIEEMDVEYAPSFESPKKQSLWSFLSSVFPTSSHKKGDDEYVAAESLVPNWDYTV